jgi:DNA-binding response OmpR family regulator
VVFNITNLICRAAMSTAPAARLLLVENDYLVAEFSKNLLESMGYQVLCSPSRTAISAINVEAFDVALLDLEPSDQLVYTIATRLRSIGTPIVLLADHPELVPSDYWDHAFLIKPFHWPELYSAINTLIRA